MGLPLYLGPARVLRLVFAREKMRATACFLLGVFLVLRGNSFIGTLIEIFGFFNLFACVQQQQPRPRSACILAVGWVGYTGPL
jgi:hypothetical protein